jgi:hypothetical protein
MLAEREAAFRCDGHVRYGGARCSTMTAADEETRGHAVPAILEQSVMRRVHDAGEDAMMALRLTRDLPGFLRTTFTVEDARRRVLGELQGREQRFLAAADRVIWPFPRSPYRRLLEYAGCERGDLHGLVAREGLEGALRILAAQGVYVSYDEFKGRRQAVRGSTRFDFVDRDFDHPYLPNHLLFLTGGSRGHPTRVRRNLPTLLDLVTPYVLMLDAHGIRYPRHVYWRGWALGWPLAHLKLGQPIDVWFYPLEDRPLFVRAGIRYVRELVKLGGRRLPRPQFCDLMEPEPIARWLVEHTSSEQPLVLSTTTSAAVRVAVAVAKLGYTLPNVYFHCRSEPLSEARRQQVRQIEAQTLTDYASMELTSIAYACPHGIVGDDMHVFTDRYAVVERSRPLFENGPEIDALTFTTLIDRSQKIALNVELGEMGRLEERACGCALGELGLRTHISEVRSFEKLSTEGTSFARTSVVRILEEVLPVRFGGTAVDYQVVEEEAADGTPVLVLRVHPGIGALDEAAVRATLLMELARESIVDEHHARLIARAESIVVERLVPLATGAGKVLPFQIQRFARGVRR